MLRIERTAQRFVPLDAPTMADVSITERYDLQEYISNSPDAFFTEMGQELFLVGKEIAPSKNVQDRIDLLAVDKEGTCVIIELKRGLHKLQMLQAISYAGMVAQWDADQVMQMLDDTQQELLVDFLDVDRDDINRQQRIVLIAEAYDDALLVGAEWLYEQYEVDIACYRISVAKDDASDSEYLVCSNVFPAPELAHEAAARGRRRRSGGQPKWGDWEAALAGISNPAVVNYFKEQIDAGQESYLPKRILRYRVGGKRRWSLSARKKNAYAWQHRRFEGDIEFWQHGLSQPDDVQPVKDDACLRFRLTSQDDFRFFHQAATKKLQSVEWKHAVDEDIGEAEVLE